MYLPYDRPRRWICGTGCTGTYGHFVSVLIRMVLTLPISSAALAIMLELGGLAGAATVGCNTQMVGFAVASYRKTGGADWFHGALERPAAVLNIVKIE